MASCGGDKQPLLWDVTTGAVIRRFRGHDNVKRLHISVYIHFYLNRKSMKLYSTKIILFLQQVQWIDLLEYGIASKFYYCYFGYY